MPQVRVIPFLEAAVRPKPSPLIIQIGRDQELTRLRGRVLNSAGFSVHSLAPDNIHSELRVMPAGCVWILCHTLEFYEHALLAVAIRKSRPTDKILRLNGMDRVQHAEGLFDASLEAAETIETLLGLVAGLSQRIAS